MIDDYHKIVRGELCPYCNCETKLVLGESVFSNKINEKPRPIYLDKKFYQCINDANHYVGTKSNNLTSLGSLADTELRKLRKEGHKIFDSLWKEKKLFKSQKKAYAWLSEKMSLPFDFTHFGMFTNDQCQRAISLCNEILNIAHHETKA